MLFSKTTTMAAAALLAVLSLGSSSTYAAPVESPIVPPVVPPVSDLGGVVPPVSDLGGVVPPVSDLGGVVPPVSDLGGVVPPVGHVVPPVSDVASINSLADALMGNAGYCLGSTLGDLFFRIIPCLVEGGVAGAKKKTDDPSNACDQDALRRFGEIAGAAYAKALPDKVTEATLAGVKGATGVN